MDNTLPTVNVFWTGGFDSSYRILELSKKKVNIQTYYLSDNRKSEKNELNAIAEIAEDIRNNPETQSILLPLIIYKASDVKPNKDITRSHRNLRKIAPLGSQYDWLARFAQEKKIHGLELGIEKSTSSTVLAVINKLGAVKLITKGDISYYIIDDKKSNSDLCKVLGNFHYPYNLYNMTKIETLAEYKKLGFEGSINKTWFCHTPINNLPCGICTPCRSVVSEGMGFRLPKSSLIRYKYRKLYDLKNIVLKIFKKINPLKQ